MLRLPHFSRKSPVPAALYACILALGFASNADAGVWVTHWSDVDPDGNGAQLVENTETGQWFVEEYWYDNLVDVWELPSGNPSPDGQDTGLGPDKETVGNLVDLLLNAGGNPFPEINFLETPLGLHLVNNGSIPGAEIDPWEFEAGMTEDFGGGGGGGGFDPQVPISEQIGKKKRKGKDDDGDGDGGGNNNGTSNDISDVNPEVVDPPPEPVTNDAKTANGLWDVPVSTQALSRSNKSFVLMGSLTPSTGGGAGRNNNNVAGLCNANLLNGALNRGVMTRGAMTIRALGGPSSAPAR